MVQAIERANRAYIVCESTEFGALVGYSKVEQYVDPKGGERAQSRIRNQVEQHLFHQFRKTGNHHYVIWEGPIDEANDALHRHNDCPF